jgi:hypothetical protein
MDWLTATVEIIKALTWPIATFVILRMFREPLVALIPLIQSFKLPGVEVTVAREVAEAKTLAQTNLPEDHLEVTPLAQLDKRTKLYQLAELAPRAAISEAWRELELAAAEAVGKICSDDLPKPLRSPMSFAEALRKDSLISTNQYNALAKLRKIRNESVHLADFSLEANVVRDYIDTALLLAQEINNIQPSA